MSEVTFWDDDYVILRFRTDRMFLIWDDLFFLYTKGNGGSYLVGIRSQVY